MIERLTKEKDIKDNTFNNINKYNATVVYWKEKRFVPS